ncbi:MAG: GNAT family N-acetyltransferase [Acidobacteriaceae bacterium]|nr:GNAT family N-acetyltransferase [Acidobacteriaceae bacterium]
MRVLADHQLACRLERAEADANARFIEARARLVPGSRAEWIQVAGAHVLFDGPNSPCTQTFGLGLTQLPDAGDMDTIERFFQDRGAPVLHEVSPLADTGLLPMLNERGYKPVEFTNVMFLPLVNRVPEPLPTTEPLEVRLAREDEREMWARTAAEGWREFTEWAEMMLDMMHVVARRDGGVCFLVELHGEPIAAGGLAIHDRVALLAGASTIPQWRRLGAQRMLLESRLDYAAQAGCDLAMFCAAPGSASQRNAERKGFHVAYTRTKFGLGSSY